MTFLSCSEMAGGDFWVSLGIDSLVGKGRENSFYNDQCTSRNSCRETGVQGCLQKSKMPGRGRRVLWMAGNRQSQEAVLCAIEIREADGFCRSLQQLDIPRREGNQYLHDHRYECKWTPCADPRSYAGHIETWRSRQVARFNDSRYSISPLPAQTLPFRSDRDFRSFLQGQVSEK